MCIFYNIHRYNMMQVGTLFRVEELDYMFRRGVIIILLLLRINMLSQPYENEIK